MDPLSVIASALKHMLASGMPHEAIIAAVAEMEAAIAKDPVAEKRRAYDRDRKREAREAARVCVSTGLPAISGESADIADIPPAPSPSPFLSPDPQPTPAPTHTPGCVSARPRKGDPFPMPEGTDPQHWADLLANRRRKRLPNTPTAHKRMMQDIARLSDDEWPPGRLIAHAAARGWAAIYDPRQDSRHDRTDRHHNQDRRPANAMVRAGLAFEAPHVAGPEYPDH